MSGTLVAGLEPIPGFRLLSPLGRGGFGVVWKASGPGGVELALKFVPLVEEVGPTELRALEVIKGIRHPHLLATFGAWQEGGYLILALELAERTLLDRYREAVGQGFAGIPAPEVHESFLEAAKGLDFLNEPRHPAGGAEPQGIQHRDIKPQNLLLVGGGVKVGDFGLARLLSHTQTGHTGSLTPTYAAPEFFRGQTSSQSDQYSLAVTYCHLRGGRPPFVGHVSEVMAGHLLEPPDLSMLPVAERSAVARALSKEPRGRWPSCRAFVRAVQEPGAVAEPGADRAATVAGWYASPREPSPGVATRTPRGDAAGGLPPRPHLEPVMSATGPPVSTAPGSSGPVPVAASAEVGLASEGPRPRSAARDVPASQPSTARRAVASGPHGVRLFGIASVLTLLTLTALVMGIGFATGVIPGANTLPLGRVRSPSPAVVSSGLALPQDQPAAPSPALPQDPARAAAAGGTSSVAPRQAEPAVPILSTSVPPPPGLGETTAQIPSEVPRSLSRPTDPHGKVPEPSAEPTPADPVAVVKGGSGGRPLDEPSATPETAPGVPVDPATGTDLTDVPVILADVTGAPSVGPEAPVTAEMNQDVDLAPSTGPDAPAISASTPDAVEDVSSSILDGASLEPEGATQTSSDAPITRGFASVEPGVGSMNPDLSGAPLSGSFEAGPFVMGPPGLGPGVMGPPGDVAPDRGADTSGGGSMNPQWDSPVAPTPGSGGLLLLGEPVTAKPVAPPPNGSGSFLLEPRTEATVSPPADAPPPTDAELYYSRAKAYYDQGDLDRSIENLDRALQLDGRMDWAYHLRAHIHLRRNDAARASADFNQAIVLAPGRADHRFCRGEAYLAAGDLRAAIADFTEALSLSPQYPQIHQNRGEAFLRSHQLAEAIADFGEALRLDPSRKEAYYMRAVAFMDMGEPGRALADCDKALELDPGFAEALQIRAQLGSGPATRLATDQPSAADQAGPAPERTAPARPGRGSSYSYQWERKPSGEWVLRKKSRGLW